MRVAPDDGGGDGAGDLDRYRGGAVMLDPALAQIAVDLHDHARRMGDVERASVLRHAADLVTSASHLDIPVQRVIDVSDRVTAILR